jgi:hypothetical protein
LIAILLLVLASLGQDESFPVENFQGPRLVNGQSATLVEHGELQMQIQHRFGDVSGGFYELFGLDQASMRLGFEYGFGKSFNVGVGRSTYLKTFDLFAKYRIAGQGNGWPFTIVLLAGSSVPSIRDYYPDTKDNFNNKVSYHFQLPMAVRWKKLGFQVNPGFLHTGYMIETAKNHNLFTLGVGGTFHITNKLSTNLEYLHPFDEAFDPAPFSIGVDLDTGGHLFQIVLSNSQRMFDQALYTNVTGDWSTGSLFFGFNLIREFTLKYY